MCKTSSFESLYNPTYALAYQMDCFQLSVEIQDFFGNVKPFLDEIENDNDMIEIYHISYLISHFVQDFIVRNHDFHSIAPLYVKRSKKCSTCTYYRLGPVNSKSFIGHFFLRIKRIFKLNILF